MSLNYYWENNPLADNPFSGATGRVSMYRCRTLPGGARQYLGGLFIDRRGFGVIAERVESYCYRRRGFIMESYSGQSSRIATLQAWIRAADTREYNLRQEYPHLAQIWYKPIRYVESPYDAVILNELPHLENPHLTSPQQKGDS